MAALWDVIAPSRLLAFLHFSPDSVPLRIPADSLRRELLLRSVTLAPRSYRVYPEVTGSGRDYQVLLAEDHTLFVEGMAELINVSARHAGDRYRQTGREAWQKVRTLRPNVALVDLHMPEMNGIEAVKRI